MESKKYSKRNKYDGEVLIWVDREILRLRSTTDLTYSWNNGISIDTFTISSILNVIDSRTGKYQKRAKGDFIRIKYAQLEQIIKPTQTTYSGK
jgi:hypothetical protein